MEIRHPNLNFPLNHQKVRKNLCLKEVFNFFLWPVFISVKKVDELKNRYQGIEQFFNKFSKSFPNLGRNFFLFGSYQI